MNPKVFIIGSGGHAVVVVDAIVEEGRFVLVGLTDSSGDASRTICGFPILGSDEFLQSQAALEIGGFVIGFGATNLLQIRRRYFEELTGRAFVGRTIVHPSASVSKMSAVGAGVTILSRVVVNARAIVGDNAILNTGAIIEHDCTIGNHTHVAPGAVLTGAVTVGCACMIGAGATLLPGIHIGDDAVVGAGAVVTRNVPSGAIVAGNPARLIKQR